MADFSEEEYAIALEESCKGTKYTPEDFLFLAKAAQVAFAQEVLSFMNDLLERDPQTLSKILFTRYETTLDVEDNTKVIVFADGGHVMLGALGIINGIMRTVTDSYLVTERGDDDIITSFRVQEEVFPEDSTES